MAKTQQRDIENECKRRDNIITFITGETGRSLHSGLALFHLESKNCM